MLKCVKCWGLLQGQFIGYMNNMKILLIGAGSIGTRHLKNLLKLGYKNLAICDPDKKRLKAVSELGNFSLYKNAKIAFKKERPEIVFVCNPTHLHLPAANLALGFGAHVFIEKPLSHNLKGVGALIKKAKKKRKIAMVACNYRFHPGFKMLENFTRNGALGKPLVVRAVVGHDLKKSRAGVDYRKTYAADAKQGGGVILDSGSHVVEYLAALFGKVTSVWGQYGNISNLDVKSEDYAFFLLNHASGVAASVELDYFSKPKRHNVEIQFERGWARWDFPGNIVEYYDSGKAVKKIKNIYKDGESYAARNDMYLKELEHFMDIVRRKKSPMQDLKSAGDVIKILMAVKSADNKM